MSYKRGDEFVLEIETATPGSYTVVGKATSLSNSDELSLIEANNMDSPDTSEFVADKVSLTFEAEVFFITSRGRAASTGSIATQTFTFQNNGLWTEIDAA